MENLPKDLENIINDYKYQLEKEDHKRRFQKTLKILEHTKKYKKILACPDMTNLMEVFGNRDNYHMDFQVANEIQVIYLNDIHHNQDVPNNITQIEHYSLIQIYIQVISEYSEVSLKIALKSYLKYNCDAGNTITELTKHW